MEIKNIPNWVVWKSEPSQNGKLTKVPYCPQSGNRAKSNDRTTWGTFDQARHAVTNGYSGIGFMFSPAANVTGIDLDHCIDERNELSDLAKAVVGKLRTYTEISPSGKGLHILACGKIPNAIKRPEIEIYSQGRYFTWTGRHLNGTPEAIEDRQIELSELYDQYTDKTQKEGSEPPKEKPIRIASDQDIISLARQAANGAKFDRLFRGDTSDFGGDHSAADLALCRILAFYTRKDSGQIDRIFRQSGLMRPKWDKVHRPKDGANYGQMTIEKAVGAQVDSYEPAQDHLADFELTTDDTEQFLLTIGADDGGNAQAVNYLYNGVFLKCDALGWLSYNGTFWKRESAESQLNRAIINTLKRRYIAAVKADKEKVKKATLPSANNVKNCKYYFTHDLVSTSVSEFDADPDLLNCRNGVINLRTGEVTSHNPHSLAQRFTYCLSVSYDPTADDSPWVNWLYSAITPEGFEGDHEPYVGLLNYLQMAVGYSLTGRTNEQCLFYLQGPTRGGKGLFSQTLAKVLGKPIAYSVDFDTFTAKRGGDSQNFDLAPLKPARFVIASESNRASLINSKMVKGITGNDAVYCAFKHRDHFEYIPQFKIWLSSNFPVMADAGDDALWGRLRVISFPNSHLGREDFTLAAKLQANAEGILSWAVAGAKEWYKRIESGQGLGHLDIITKTTKAQRAENDTVQMFIDDQCAIGDDKFTTGKSFTYHYNEWCKENNISPLGGRRLGQAMRSKGFVYKDKWFTEKTVKCWLGIGLN